MSDISILILSTKRATYEQIKNVLREYRFHTSISSFFNEFEHQKILVTTYQALSRSKTLDLTVFDFDEAQFLKNEKYKILFECNQTKYLGIFQEP